MDKRRLDTGEVLAAGILNIEPPETDTPDDREMFNPEDNGCNFVGEDAVIDALEKGMIVEALNYYGVPRVWKREPKEYRAMLLQYRSVTENHTFKTPKEAAEWFAEAFYGTDG